jgi:polyisoprenoid-binding protein YceI
MIPGLFLLVTKNQHNMKKILLVVALVAIGIFVTNLSKGQGTWTLDKAHSSVKFTVEHLVISEVEGNFTDFDGTLVSTGPDFSNAKIGFTVNVASVNTDNEMRDDHLRSDDFFNAEKFPKMTFQSVSFKKVNDKKYELTGDLTIRDVTKRVRFDVVYGGTVKDPWGNTKAGFKATTTINRFDYHLKWNSLTEMGGAVAGSDVNITVNVEFALQK